MIAWLLLGCTPAPTRLASMRSPVEERDTHAHTHRPHRWVHHEPASCRVNFHRNTVIGKTSITRPHMVVGFPRLGGRRARYIYLYQI